MTIIASTDMTSTPSGTTSQLQSKTTALFKTNQQINVTTTTSSITDIITKTSGVTPKKSAKPSDTESEYRTQMKMLLMILLIIISITCILITVLAAVCFNYLKIKRSNIRNDQCEGSIVSLKTIESETASDSESHQENNK